MSLSRVLLVIFGALTLLVVAVYVVPIAFIFAVVVLTGGGQPSFDRDNGSIWVGRKMADVTLHYGPPSGTLITRDNKKEYIHDYNSGYGPCLLFWVVDRDEVVMGWHHEGRGCTQSWRVEF